jgi:hypothetical protein
MNLKRRPERPEQREPDRASEVFRVLVRCVSGAPNLAVSKCWRTRNPNGVVTELIELVF